MSTHAHMITYAFFPLAKVHSATVHVFACSQCVSQKIGKLWYTWNDKLDKPT